MLFQDRDCIVFAGDSVTDMGSANPVGDSPLWDALGRSYVRIIDNYISAFYPELTIRIINSGIGGNTSRDMLERWDRDVTKYNPDYVSLLIGINDVWRQFDSPAQENQAVSIDEYRQNLVKMVSSTIPNVKKMFMITPYYMEPNTSDMMRSKMGEYAEVAKEVAKEYGCEIVDIQAMFDHYFKYKHSSFIAWDRIHPNQVGATLIAREFLNLCDFDYSHLAK